MLFSALAPTVRGELATGAAAQTEDRYPERRISFPDGVTGLADVTYSTPPGFRPLHGGGWLGGHSRHSGAFEDWPRVLASLAARGYGVASVNYRLRAEATSPAAAWLRGAGRPPPPAKQACGRCTRPSSFSTVPSQGPRGENPQLAGVKSRHTIASRRPPCTAPRTNC